MLLLDPLRRPFTSHPLEVEESAPMDSTPVRRTSGCNKSMGMLSIISILIFLPRQVLEARWVLFQELVGRLETVAPRHLHQEAQIRTLVV